MALQSVVRKVALITGANQGIGLEVARRPSRQGMTALVGARCGAGTRSRRGSLIRRHQRLLHPALYDQPGHYRSGGTLN
jgi:NAD(P)-dependent dehydrogenase (short-subunit alcohol dehydrogenase family)